MSDLTAKEQKAVRTALRFLRLRVGAWAPLAKALRYEWDSSRRSPPGRRRSRQRSRCVSPGSLACRWMSYSRASGSRPGYAAHCGHPPDDFVDEDTIAG
jgi:hypothetical protein